MNKKEIQRIAYAPERIWLQIGDDGLDNTTRDVDWGEVSWCQDKIFDSDIEYVRVDHCKRAKREQGKEGQCDY